MIEFTKCPCRQCRLVKPETSIKYHGILLPMFYILNVISTNIPLLCCFVLAQKVQRTEIFVVKQMSQKEKMQNTVIYILEYFVISVVKWHRTTGIPKAITQRDMGGLIIKQSHQALQ